MTSDQGRFGSSELIPKVIDSDPFDGAQWRGGQARRVARCGIIGQAPQCTRHCAPPEAAFL